MVSFAYFNGEKNANNNRIFVKRKFHIYDKNRARMLLRNVISKGVASFYCTKKGNLTPVINRIQN